MAQPFHSLVDQPEKLVRRQADEPPDSRQQPGELDTQGKELLQILDLPLFRLAAELDDRVVAH